MPSLGDSARAYFEAGGYRVVRQSTGFLDLVRLEPRKGLPTRLLVWSEHPGLAVPSSELGADERMLRVEREAELIQSFERELAESPEAVGYFLVSRRLGLSAAFVTRATAILGGRRGGGIRVPGELFDAGYKVDGESGKAAKSVMGDVLAQAARLKRVAQPFHTRHGLGERDVKPGIGDLVEVLDTAIRDTGRGPRLILIDGSAGGGKSVAFNALVRLAYEEAMAAKRAKVPARRPIVFLPEHIRGETIGYVDDVIDAAVSSDIATAVEPEQVRWLLKNGYALWMFDGLDEFYAGDNDFIAFLEGVLSEPGSEALIVLSSRDSLISTSETLRAFLKRFLSLGRVEIYELAPWDAQCWRQLAWMELEGGRAGAENSERVGSFVKGLEGAPHIAALARLPFYCTLILERFKASRSLPTDELELLDLVLERMIDREHGKEIFRWQDFVDAGALVEHLEEDERVVLEAGARDGRPEDVVAAVLDRLGRDNLVELIEGVAHSHQRNPGSGGPGAGFDAGMLREVFGPGYISSDLDEGDERRLSTVLVQFALFGPGRAAGSVDFTHQILADYLAGRHALGLLRHEAEQQELLRAARQSETPSDVQRRVSVFRQAIGTAPFHSQSMFHRVLARGVAEDARLRTFLASLRASGGLDRKNAADALEALVGPS